LHTGLSITSIADIGSGFDLLCDPVCLNDGQCHHAIDTGSTSCLCAPGFDGVDCSNLGVLPGGAASLADRAFVANAGETANIALSAVSGNSRLG
jgi:hypothetical protein